MRAKVKESERPTLLMVAAAAVAATVDSLARPRPVALALSLSSLGECGSVLKDEWLAGGRSGGRGALSGWRPVFTHEIL